MLRLTSRPAHATAPHNGPVQAIIVRPVSPMVAVQLSDGSTIRVQPDHPFWVDGGPGQSGAGWVKAGQLRPGDRLRTTRGQGHAVTVVRVRQHAGKAVVYTLTVAQDHTFFVGIAKVLVHNCPYPLPDEIAQATSVADDIRVGNRALS